MDTLEQTGSDLERLEMIVFTPVETARTRPSASVRARFAFHGLIQGLRSRAARCCCACSVHTP